MGRRALACLLVLCGGCGAAQAGSTRADGEEVSAGASPTSADSTTPVGGPPPGADAPSEGPPVAPSPPATARFDSADIPSRGNPAAAVVVQVFSDFECPFCSMARRHADRLLTDFPSVRVEYRHFPLSMHQHARMAAEASVEAYAQGGSEAFWCFHDQLFDHQRDLSRQRIVSFASTCGLDRQALSRALDDARHAARVELDLAEGARLGVQGTPTFTVNGAMVEGADYTDLEEAVDRVHPSW